MSGESNQGLSPRDVFNLNYNMSMLNETIKKQKNEINELKEMIKEILELVRDLDNEWFNNINTSIFLSS